MRPLWRDMILKVWGADPEPDWFDQSQTWQTPETHLEDGSILVLEYT
jgi:hypothetical protein